MFLIQQLVCTVHAQPTTHVPVDGCRYVVDLDLQCVTFYLTQTPSLNRAPQAYVVKPNNDTHPCQKDSWELIISVATHTSCQA